MPATQAGQLELSLLTLVNFLLTQVSHDLRQSCVHSNQWVYCSQQVLPFTSGRHTARSHTCVRVITASNASGAVDSTFCCRISKFSPLLHLRNALAGKKAAAQPFDRRKLLSVPLLGALAGIVLKQPAWGATTGVLHQ